MERIEAKVFYEIYTIHLDHVHLCSELYFLHLLPPNNGPYVTFRDRYDPARQTLYCLEDLGLLGQHLPDHSFLLTILLRELDPDAVLILDLILLLDEFVQQVQQAPGGLLPGLLAHTHICKVLLFLFQELGPGSRDLQILAGQFQLTIYPIYTLPQ